MQNVNKSFNFSKMIFEIVTNGGNSLPNQENNEEIVYEMGTVYFMEGVTFVIFKSTIFRERLYTLLRSEN